MNRKLKIVCLYSISILHILLNEGCKRTDKQEFTVYYFCGAIEPMRPFECDELERYCKTDEYEDTIFIDANMADQISKAILKAKSSNAATKAESIKNNCILSPLIYVNAGNSDLCLNATDNMCWVKDDNNKYNLSILSDSVSYILKWKSMYYDYLPPYILKYYKGIQQYGIPADYNHEKTDSLWPKDTSKILLKVK